MKPEYGIRQHPGGPRELSAERFWVIEEQQLYVLLQAWGEDSASGTAGEIAYNALSESPFPAKTELSLDFLIERIQRANSSLFRASREAQSARAVGCSLVATKISRAEIAIAHIGDCRAYLFRQGNLYRLTEDHSVALTRRDGTANPAFGQGDFMPKALARYLGKHSQALIDTLILRHQPGDGILLCTDGFWNSLSEDQAGRILSDQGKTIAKVTEQLIQMAVHAKPSHCSSLLLIRFPGKGKSARRGSSCLIYGASGVLTVGIVGLALHFSDLLPGRSLISTFTKGPEATPSFTFTPSRAASATKRPTFTPTLAAKALPSPTRKPTRTMVSRATPTKILTPTSTSTRTGTATPTLTATTPPTATPRNTPTRERPSTPSATPVRTLTPTPSFTLTGTRTPTATLTPAPSATSTKTATVTETVTPIPTVTPTSAAAAMTYQQAEQMFDQLKSAVEAAEVDAFISEGVEPRGDERIWKAWKRGGLDQLRWDGPAQPRTDGRSFERTGQTMGKGAGTPRIRVRIYQDQEVTVIEVETVQ